MRMALIWALIWAKRHKKVNVCARLENPKELINKSSSIEVELINTKKEATNPKQRKAKTGQPRLVSLPHFFTKLNTN
jgi:hypothetical protein